MNKQTSSVDVYERLAMRLMRCRRVHRTPSGLEIELIKLVFTSEEARVAST